MKQQREKTYSNAKGDQSTNTITVMIDDRYKVKSEKRGCYLEIWSEVRDGVSGWISWIRWDYVFVTFGADYCTS